MKARIILTGCVALALFVPAAHAGTDNTALGTAPATSAEITAMTIRGDGLNRLYHLGKYSTSRSNADATRALTLRGEALNRTYGLGSYAPVTIVSDVANSAAVARQQTTDTSDALSRYQHNVTTGEPVGQTFSSDVANSDAVSRFVANHGSDGVTVSSGGDGVFRSPATDAGIAICLLLISLGGFMLARGRNRPVRPV